MDLSLPETILTQEPTALRTRRVLHVCDFHLKYAASLAGGMAEHGHDVALLTRDHDREFGDEPGAMRRYVAPKERGITHHVLPGRIREASALPAVSRMHRTLSAFGADVVHFQESVGTDPRLLAVAGVPWGRLALTVHDPTPHPGEDWPLIRRVGMRALIRGAGVIFVHSDVLRDALIESAAPKAPVVVVPHGIDPPIVAPLPDKPSLLFFGRIATYYKGLDVLLDAMSRVWDRVPETTLVIAGAGDIEDHPNLSDSRVTLRNEHVADEDVPSLFAAATCCVLPYREASQSGVGSRAKSYGRGIVATDVGGLPELVGEDAGRLVPAGDPDALASALVEVVTDRDVAEAIGGAAARSTREASWNRVAETTVQAYEEHILSRP